MLCISDGHYKDSKDKDLDMIMSVVVAKPSSLQPVDLLYFSNPNVDASHVYYCLSSVV